eukprot:m.109813 g.109813  ORF g.109813 m.109813 type:complete len:86 (-) comp19163_c4_seq1:34-291(-)
MYEYSAVLRQDAPIAATPTQQRVCAPPLAYTPQGNSGAGDKKPFAPAQFLSQHQQHEHQQQQTQLQTPPGPVLMRCTSADNPLSA